MSAAMSADTPRTDLEPSEIDKAFGRILMFIAERGDPPNQEYLDAHNAVDFLREELDRRAPSSASPPECIEYEKALRVAQVLAGLHDDVLDLIEKVREPYAKVCEAYYEGKSEPPAPRFTEAEVDALEAAVELIAWRAEPREGREPLDAETDRKHAATLRAMLSPQGKP